MIIHGKERGFRRTVWASVEIAKICPGRDIDKLPDLLRQDHASAMETTAKLISILINADEKAREYEEPGYKADLISADELLMLPDSIFKEVEEEAMKLYNADSQTTVEVENDSKKNGEEPRE